MVEARHPETGGVPGGLPRGGEVQPRGLEARDAAQALRAAGAQDLRRLRLVGRVVAGGHGARVAARARLRRAQGGPRAHGRRRHRQDAHGVGPLRAGVREEARGALLHGVLARDAPEARPRRREARPGGRAHRQGPPARHRRARVPPARRGRGEAALPGLRRRIREAVGGDHHEPGVQQVGVGVRGRPDGRRRDRPHRPPREARPVPRRVLPRPPCPHAGGLAAQKACALPMLRLLNFRCSFCSNPLDETQACRRRCERPLAVAVSAVRPATAQLVGLGVHRGVHDLFGESGEQLPHVDGAVAETGHGEYVWRRV